MGSAVERVVDAMVADGRSARALDGLKVNVGQQAQQLQRKIRAGQANSTEEDEYRVWVRNAGYPSELQGGFLESLRTGGELALDAEQIRILTILRENSRWEVPLVFRVLDQTEKRWVVLGEALTVEKQSV